MASFGWPYRSPVPLISMTTAQRSGDSSVAWAPSSTGNSKPSTSILRIKIAGSVTTESRVTSGVSNFTLRSPSGFNFFRPGYVPPNTGIGSASLVAPECQITDEATGEGCRNFAFLKERVPDENRK